MFYKIFLDDMRDAPPGWIRTYSVEETINYLLTRKVDYLSLDNDLGENTLEGYNVLNWLEQKVFEDNTFPIPEVTVHSSNSARRSSMFLTIRSIERIRQQQIGGS